MDRVRKLILKEAEERGITLAELSRQCGKNHAYFQQFIQRGVPRELPERVRHRLAVALGKDESELRRTEPTRRGHVVDAEFTRPTPSISEDGRIGVPPGEIPQVASRIGLGLGTDEPTIEIPAGDGSIAAVPILATWRIPMSVLARRLRGSIADLHIVECEGDSMEPRIHDGDFVFIDVSRRVPSPPGIFALNDGFGQTLKRLELVPNSDPPRVKLIPDNPRHETYERELEEVRIIGRYLCRLTME